MASSSVRAVVLGHAVAQSALGQPLRVTIPLDTVRGEKIAADCFSLVRPTGDGPAPIVTAKVSLERAAAGFRLVLTTREPINEPAIRLAVQDSCNGTTRRDYIVLLDPAQKVSANAPSAARAGRSAPAGRAPGQEPPAAAALAAAVRRDSPESSGTGQRVAQRPVGAEGSARSSIETDSAARERMLAALPSQHAALLPVAAVTDKVRAPLPAARGERAASDNQEDIWWTIAVTGGGLLAVILGALLVRHGRAAPAAPEWARLTESTGPRSVTNLAAAPVTLSSGDGSGSSELPNPAVTLPNLTLRSRARSIAPAPRSVAKSAPASLTEQNSDSLLDEIEADLVELRAVREAHDAARRNKQDRGGDAILQAIEDAERDLLLDSPAAADSAMERSLEDELQIPAHRPRKAAA